jgi:hypothetical protein
MSRPKPPLPTEWPNTFECGAGIVLYGKRYLVAEMTTEQMNQGCIMLRAHLVSYEQIDPTLYYASPKRIKRPRKKKAK